MDKPILAAMLSCSGLRLTDDEKYLFARYNPLGITLFSRNLQQKEQVASLVNDIKNVINRDDVLVAVDEEGGRVSRLKSLENSQYVSAELLGQNSIEYSKYHAELISAEMRELGINVNYAPVVDKTTSPQNPVLMGRCFSSNGNDIVKYASQMADTYISLGICPCIKHIPTHFSAISDPHLNSLETDLSVKEIENEIAYLQAFQNYPMAMTAHIKIRAMDEDYPVTMSKKVIENLIRKYLEFNGFLLSDAIDMHALQGNITHRAILSLDAGVDAVCYCSGVYKDMAAICQEQRFMTENALIRFAKIKNILHNTSKYINVEYAKKHYNENFSHQQDRQYSYDATEILNQMLKKGENL